MLEEDSAESRASGMFPLHLCPKKLSVGRHNLCSGNKLRDRAVFEESKRAEMARVVNGCNAVLKVSSGRPRLRQRRGAARRGGASVKADGVVSCESFRSGVWRTRSSYFTIGVNYSECFRRYELPWLPRSLAG